MPEQPGWSWDPSLYEGSAGYYATGRAPYPAELADRIAAELGLDGTGRLLDVGCGPGSLTLLLAPRFAAATGVDADAGMIAAGRAADPAIDWRVLRAEELPAGLGTYRVVTFAQSFHWLDRPRVAAVARGMLEPGGALVHVGATTHRGTDPTGPLPHPQPPWPAIEDLVRGYLGTDRRAGQGTLPGGTPGDEDDVFRAAGFTGPVELEAPGRVLARTADQVVAAVFSLSYAAPHLFAGRFAAFERDLRGLLRAASPDGVFSEQMREVTAKVWRP